MALNLSEQQRIELEAELAKAEPYDENDPVLNTLDGEIDFDRWCATMARKFLRQDDEEKQL